MRISQQTLMNEWGFIGQDIFVEIGKSAQVLSLNQGVAICETLASIRVRTNRNNKVGRKDTKMAGESKILVRENPYSSASLPTPNLEIRDGASL